MDILTGKMCCLFSFLVLTSCIIGKFVHPGDGIKRGGGIVIFASWEYYFIRVLENLVYHPSNNLSISIGNILYFNILFELG